MEIKETEGDWEAVEFVRRLSPVASQHLMFTGRYEFNKNMQPINIAGILESMRKILNKYVKTNELPS